MNPAANATLVNQRPTVPEWRDQLPTTQPSVPEWRIDAVLGLHLG
jgi:hypothetical protein